MVAGFSRAVDVDRTAEHEARSEGRAELGFGSGFTSLCGAYDPDPLFPWSAGSRKEGRSPEMNPRVRD